MSYALAIFWIAVTVLTTLSFTAIIDPNNMGVSAQVNSTTSGMMEYSGNMTDSMNATLTDDCEENMTAEECDTGNISRRGRVQ
jgi:hypothetical protein